MVEWRKSGVDLCWYSDRTVLFVAENSVVLFHSVFFSKAMSQHESTPCQGSFVCTSQWTAEMQLVFATMHTPCTEDPISMLAGGVSQLLILFLVGGDWNMAFVFPYIGNNHPNWLSYFLEELKPPTSWSLGACILWKAKVLLIFFTPYGRTKLQQQFSCSKAASATEFGIVGCPTTGQDGIHFESMPLRKSERGVDGTITVLAPAH